MAKTKVQQLDQCVTENPHVTRQAEIISWGDQLANVKARLAINNYEVALAMEELVKLRAFTVEGLDRHNTATAPLVEATKVQFARLTEAYKNAQQQETVA